MTKRTYEGDDLNISVSILDDDGEVFDLTDATVSASAKRGRNVVPAVATIDSAAGGTAKMRWNDDELTAGDWLIQFQVTKDGVTQVVYSEAWSVLPSAFH